MDENVPGKIPKVQFNDAKRTSVNLPPTTAHYDREAKD